MAESEIERTNWTEEQLVMQFIGKARMAKAEKNIFAYFTFFEGAFGMMLAYMPLDIRKECEADYMDFIVKRHEIQKSDKNEKTKTDAINDLMLNFADTHNLFVYQSLQYRGWQKPEIDAELDWKDITVDEFEALVRAKKLLPSEEENGAKIE